MPWGFYYSFAAGAQQGVDWRLRRILKTSLAGAKRGSPYGHTQQKTRLAPGFLKERYLYRCIVLQLFVYLIPSLSMR